MSIDGNVLILVGVGFVVSLAAMLYILRTYNGRPVNFVQDAAENIPVFALVSLTALPAAVVLMLPYQVFRFVWKTIFEVIPPGENL
jgi:hypothetical protein